MPATPCSPRAARSPRQAVAQRFGLDADSDPQHYGIGIKEIWEIPPEKHEPGLVVHGLGWPLKESGSSGGAFLYHADDNQVYIGLITDLNYSNPTCLPTRNSSAGSTTRKR
jgi:electron-transferring-flavoprotein dehydrogenase